MRALSYANVMSTVAVFLALGGGAWAVSKPSGGTINACTDKRGNLRLLVKGTRCPRGYKALSWNTTGPQGVAGPAGATGPAGAVVQGSPAVPAVTSTDPRLSDARTPAGPAGGALEGSFPNPALAEGAVTATKLDPSLRDGAAATPTLRSLGTGGSQAAAGDDPRLADSRPPTGAAGGALSGTFPSPALAGNSVTSATVTDGSLRLSDLIVGQFSGTLSLTAMTPGRCDRNPVLMSGAQSGDQFLVELQDAPSGLIATANSSATPGTFVWQYCNVGATTIPVVTVKFRLIALRP